MDLVIPDPGLIFWQVVVFVIVLLVLRRFAWSPIMSGLKEREGQISEALTKAKEAEIRLQELEKKNAKIEEEGLQRKEVILKEARTTSQKMVDEAKEDARKQADEMIQRAKEEINRERDAAAAQLKNEVANLAIEISEKIIRRELSSKEAHNDLVNDYLKDQPLS